MFVQIIVLLCCSVSLCDPVVSVTSVIGVPINANRQLQRVARGTWFHVFVAGIVVASIARSATAQPYSARRNGDVVQLEDAKTQTAVSIVPAVGDVAFEMKVKGQNVLRWPYASVDEFKARPALSGIPFLGPWANRLDEQAFYANGTRYAFDMDLGNVHGAIPIHGFLASTSLWQVVELNADRTSAWLTSRLDFYRQPMWMKQWPFAHTIEITHRLQDGVLEVSTTITNMSAEPMPVAIGFHPYFRLTDSARDEWTIAVGARTHWLLAPNKVPTGETEPIERLFPNPQAARLSEHALDATTGKLKWKFEMTDVTDSGILTTASDLLFTGGREGYFQALDARTGSLLWKANLGAQIVNGPITYEVDGKQHVATIAGLSLCVFGLRE